MNATKINLLSNVLNQNIVDIIHKRLIECPRWLIATNRVNIDLFQRSEQATDSGFILCSYENHEKDFKFSLDSNDDPVFRELNFYADLIFELCLQQCYDGLGFDRLPIFTNLRVARYFWNYYHNDSKGTSHIDYNENNYWSIIFYVNDCPEGGTVIIDDLGVEHIVPHVPGDAVIFPSTFRHRGLSPNKNHHRCCLNILFKADRMGNIVNIEQKNDNKDTD